MFRTVLLAAVVPLALGSEYSYTYDYTDAPSAAPTTETMAPTRSDTYAPTRMTEAPSYAPTTETYAPTMAPTGIIGHALGSGHSVYYRLCTVASVCFRDRRKVGGGSQSDRRAASGLRN